MTRLKILVVDDHPIFRDGLRAAFAAGDIEVVGEAASAAEAVELFGRLRPDVVLMALAMPGGSGIDATRTITTAGPAAAVLVLTMSDDEDTVFAAIQAGARGYILKGADRDELARTIRSVADGDAVFGAGIAHRLLRSFGTAETTGRRLLPELTDREREVLSLVATGYTNPAIARHLVVSPKTIRNHVSNILTKLQATNREEAARIARQAGLGPQPTLPPQP